MQEITVLSEEYGLTAGSFWLMLSIPNNDATRHYTNLKSNSISDSIPYNATREQLQSAIAKIQGIENIRVFHQERGKYRVEFFVQDSHESPLFQLYRCTLEGQHSKQDIKGKERDAIVIKRIVSAQLKKLKDRIFATVSFLESQKIYEFRVCAENKDSRGAWSKVLSNVTTDPTLVEKKKGPTQLQINSIHAKQIQGSGRYPGNIDDTDYIAPIGMGGFDGKDGIDGMALLISYSKIKSTTPLKHYFFCSTQPQKFVIPQNLISSDSSHPFIIEYIDVKMWGAGGAGGGSILNSSSKWYFVEVFSILYRV